MHFCKNEVENRRGKCYAGKIEPRRLNWREGNEHAFLQIEDGSWTLKVQAGLKHDGEKIGR